MLTCSITSVFVNIVSFCQQRWELTATATADVNQRQREIRPEAVHQSTHTCSNPRPSPSGCRRLEPDRHLEHLVLRSHLLSALRRRASSLQKSLELCPFNHPDKGQPGNSWRPGRPNRQSSQMAPGAPKASPAQAKERRPKRSRFWSNIIKVRSCEREELGIFAARIREGRGG